MSLAGKRGEVGSTLHCVIGENQLRLHARVYPYGDLIKMGVIVPTKVERSALQNAASIAGLLLTTDAIISEIKEDKPEPAGAGARGYERDVLSWAKRDVRRRTAKAVRLFLFLFYWTYGAGFLKQRSLESSIVMATAPLLTREFIESILREERDDRRFEELCADLFSASEGVRYTTTAPTRDESRDAYSSVVGGTAQVCATTQEQNVGTKIKKDIDGQSTSSMVIKRIHCCCTQSLSEETRDKLTEYLREKIPSTQIREIHGLKQIVDRSFHHQDVFSNRYVTEIAKFENWLERQQEAGRSSLQSDLFNVVMACRSHSDLMAQREEVLRHLLLAAFRGMKPLSLSQISAAVGAQLLLETAPRKEYIAAGLQKHIDAGDVRSIPKGFILTSRGEAALQAQLADASSHVRAGRNILTEALGLSKEFLSAREIDDVWEVFHWTVAHRFLYAGCRFVQDLQSLGDNDSSDNSHPEFQTFIHDLTKSVSQLKIGTSAKRLVLDAVAQFNDPRSKAFSWLSRAAVKYLVLCTLGLDPQVERDFSRKIAQWVISPDTHVVLAHLCEGDVDHSKCNAVLSAAAKAASGIVISEAVINETENHARLAQRGFSDFNERYHAAKLQNGSVKPVDLLKHDDNALIKEFAFRCGSVWQPHQWPKFLRQFVNSSEDFNRPIVRLLLKQLNAKIPADDGWDIATGAKLAILSENLKSYREQTSERRTWDGRLIASSVRESQQLDPKKTFIILSDSQMLRDVYAILAQKNKAQIRICRSALIAYSLMLRPGSSMNLETIRHLLLGANEHGFNDRRLPNLAELPAHGDDFRVSGSSDIASDDQLLDDNWSG